MKRDFRYIFRRVVTAILIGLFFYGFKSCEVHASGYLSGTVNIDYYYQNCTKQDLTLWQCDNSYIENVNGPISFTGDAPVINSNISNNISDYDKVLTRVIYTFDFTPIEMGNNCNNYNCSIDTRSQYSIFGDKRTDNYIQLNNSIPHTNASSFNNFFVNTPYENLLAYHLYYAEYFDSDIEEWKPLQVSMSTNMILRNNNWSDGQHISGLRFYLGSPSDINYMEGGVATSNPYVPVLPHYYEYIIDKYNDSKYSNWQLFAINVLPTWINNSNSSIFPIAFYPKGVAITTSSYTRRTYDLYYSNNNSGSGYTLFDYTQTTLQDKINQSQEIVNSLTDEIENSLSNSATQEAIGTDYDPNELNGLNAQLSLFQNTHGSNFTGLFTSLFVRPLQLLQNQANIDLVNRNINGTLLLDRHLCNQNAGVGNVVLPGGGVNYHVELWHGYGFDIPCPHTEIYPLLKYGSYGFYGQTFLGADIGGNSTIYYNFADIWLLIQHGILIYLLFVTCLNMYKYILDSDKTEVEVLEL